ncbi:unnamed protein product [Heterobilharzia americana]|nr:unnamed protein product [Heterobilharzia americana]
MVCVPCIIIPILLWILHRLLLPVIHFFIPSLKHHPEDVKEELKEQHDNVEDDSVDVQTSGIKPKSE